jgi:Putative zinc-finger
MESHDEFLELCALSTSGDLTEEERRELLAHLSECAECREALKEFETAVDVGVPLLSSRLVREPVSDLRASGEEPPEGNDANDSGERAFAFAHRNGYRPSRVNWNHVWLPFAACILLSLALGTYSYRLGRDRPSQVVSENRPDSNSTQTTALEQQISDADHDRQLLRDQLAERERAMASLRLQINQQSTSLERIRTAQASLEQSLQNDQAERERITGERSALEQKLDLAQTSVQQMQAELESARQQRSEGEAQDGSLEAQIKDLNGQLRDREQTINKQDDLLSHDRDIRDLMGARDLYIAEVYDVGRDGATQKPCGRVFYTKGKSLVFYAYDLDEQPGVRNARTFQAWGRRGADMQEALNLGIFFEDSAAKKRWVLKFDDAKTLEQIDAVFVTVEPNGGSHKPSGKPLLFAYLKVDPNHP